MVKKRRLSLAAAADPALDPIFQALSDGTRRAILQRLAVSPSTVGDLAGPFHMSLAAVSKHLKILERTGLITREARGRERVCRLQAQSMAQAYEWLAFYERFWNERLDALEQLVNQSKDKSEQNHGQ